MKPIDLHNIEAYKKDILRNLESICNINYRPALVYPLQQIRGLLNSAWEIASRCDEPSYLDFCDFEMWVNDEVEYHENRIDNSVRPQQFDYVDSFCEEFLSNGNGQIVSHDSDDSENECEPKIVTIENPPPSMIDRVRNYFFQPADKDVQESQSNFNVKRAMLDLDNDLDGYHHQLFEQLTYDNYIEVRKEFKLILDKAYKLARKYPEQLSLANFFHAFAIEELMKMKHHLEQGSPVPPKVRLYKEKRSYLKAVAKELENLDFQANSLTKWKFTKLKSSLLKTNSVPSTVEPIASVSYESSVRHLFTNSFTSFANDESLESMSHLFACQPHFGSNAVDSENHISYLFHESSNCFESNEINKGVTPLHRRKHKRPRKTYTSSLSLSIETNDDQSSTSSDAHIVRDATPAHSPLPLNISSIASDSISKWRSLFQSSINVLLTPVKIIRLINHTYPTVKRLINSSRAKAYSIRTDFLLGMVKRKSDMIDAVEHST